MEIENVVIENKIAEYRKELGLSQHKLAKAVGLKRGQSWPTRTTPLVQLLKQPTRSARYWARTSRKFLYLSEVFYGIII